MLLTELYSIFNALAISVIATAKLTSTTFILTTFHSLAIDDDFMMHLSLSTHDYSTALKKEFVDFLCK